MKKQPPEQPAPRAHGDQVAIAMSQVMQQAAMAYTRGAWAEAERLCREILATRGEYLDALNLLGIIAAQTQRTEEAAALLGRAVAANPGDAAAHSNYGNVLRGLKRFAEALDSYARALEIKPDYAEAHNNRGNTLRELERFGEALQSYSRALEIKPDYAEACNNRGVTLQELGRFEEALQSFTRALKIKPDYAGAHNNHGVALQELKRFEEALQSFARALQVNPDYAEAHSNRGNTLRGLKRFAEALQSYARALKIKPDYAEAHNNRGVTLQELKRLEEALDSYAQALKLKPDYAEAYNNRGVTLQELKRFEEALDSYARALKIKPDYAEAHNNRGNTLRELKRFEEALDSFGPAIKADHAEAHNNRGVTLQELKRFEEALDSYARALKIKPDYAEAHNNRGNTLRELKRFEEALDSYAQALNIQSNGDWLYGTWLHANMQLCNWSDFESRIANLTAKIQQAEKATLPFSVLGLIDSLTLQRQAAGTWVREKYPPSRILPPLSKRRRGDRIRVGYFSPDYREHPVSLLTAQLFEMHDRRRFEVTGFSFGADTQDAMRERLERGFERFIDVRRNSDQEITQLARRMGIDIAVDLGGFTQDGRPQIFALRAAPVQVGYLGYSGTSGAPYMDYLIADATLIPAESRAHYSEQIAYLPHSYMPRDSKQCIAEKVFTREELGLPQKGFVYCCFNNSYKISPGTFDGWMRILKQVPGGVLWLTQGNAIAVDNLRQEAQRRGVAGERLIFAPRMASMEEHLARHRAADLFLDTLPCNAHTTASDALWAGLPVLTRMGESFAARVAASLLYAIGLPELVTTTQAQYESTAIELAADPGRVAQFKDRLHRNRLTMPLFDTEQFTRDLENSYTQMYERYQADSSPQHIYVAR